MSGPRVEVVTERHVPTMPELQYHRQNAEEIRSFQKEEHARQARHLDDADFYLERKRYRAPNGITRKRIWPRPA